MYDCDGPLGSLGLGFDTTGASIIQTYVYNCITDAPTPSPTVSPAPDADLANLGVILGIAFAGVGLLVTIIFGICRLQRQQTGFFNRVYDFFGIKRPEKRQPWYKRLFNSE